MQMDNRKKISILTLQKRKQQKRPITMITAYDYTSAILVDRAEVDAALDQQQPGSGAIFAA